MLPVALTLLAWTWIACHKDNNTQPYEKKVEVTFSGRILDQSGSPMMGVTVQAGDQSMTTDVNGVFRLKPVKAPYKHAILKASKQGYFDFTRAYVVQDQSILTLTVQLMTRDLVANLNNAQGGTVSVTGGATLRFPQGSVSNADGSAYNGNVQVYAHYLDPTDPNLRLYMPGDLRAVGTGGSEGLLATFGMIGVELSGNGAPVKVAAGKEVEIDLPIQSAQLAAAPNEIPLWYFDTEQALWIEEGKATKTGNRYVGTVRHFSFWNCDFPIDAVEMQGSVFVNDQQHPLDGAEIVIERTVPFGGGGHGTSNGAGWFGGKIPKNEQLKLTVYAPWSIDCGYSKILFEQTIGPFTSDVTLPPIIVQLTPTNQFVLTGRLLDCTQQPVTNGYVRCLFQNYIYFEAFPDANGMFSITTNLCNPISGFASITGYDLNNYLVSAPQTVTLSGNTVNAGDIHVCNALPEFIRIQLDGVNSTYPDVSAYFYAPNMIISGSSAVPQGFISMQFMDKDSTTGTFPLTSIYVAPFADTTNTQVNINTNVQHFGNSGDFIIGNFQGTFNASGTSHTISGEYKVKR